MASHIVKSRRGRLVALSAAGVVALGIAAYAWKGQEIVYGLQLLSAEVVSTLFYATSPAVTKNIPYGPLPSERLDVYRPSTPGKHPVLIFVHGGGWRSYSKELHSPVAQRLLPEDMVVVLPGYTLASGTSYRRQTAETAAAVAWTLENIEQYGGDASRVFVGGQSAGAHLAALAVLDPQWLAARHHSSSELAGLYGIAGPYDIEKQFEFEKENGRSGERLFDVFRDREGFAAGSPVNFVRPDLPPVLLIHGDADDTVPLRVSEEFHSRLVAAGARSTLLIYPRAGHAGLLFDALATNPARLVLDLSRFVRGEKE